MAPSHCLSGNNVLVRLCKKSPLLPFLWHFFVLVLSFADGNGLLSLLAKLFAGLGKLAHRKLRHGQTLDNLPLATRAGDWET